MSERTVHDGHSATKPPGEGHRTGTGGPDAPGASEGLDAAIRAAAEALWRHAQRGQFDKLAWADIPDHWRPEKFEQAEAAVRAAEPLLRQAVAEELTRTTGVAIRTKLRRILANHNANFCAESEIDERVQEIIDLIVPAARLQERSRVAEQFTAALLTGLDDLQRDQHRRIGPGDVTDLVARVALEVGR